RRTQSDLGGYQPRAPARETPDAIVANVWCLPRWRSGLVTPQMRRLHRANGSERPLAVVVERAIALTILHRVHAGADGARLLGNGDAAAKFADRLQRLRPPPILP